MSETCLSRFGLHDGCALSIRADELTKELKNPTTNVKWRVAHQTQHRLVEGSFLFNGNLSLRQTGDPDVIDPSNGVIFVTDNYGAQDTKSIQIDKNNGQITIVGVIHPKTGKIDPEYGQVLVVGRHIDPVVEVTTFAGKLDTKKGVIEPKHSVIESSTGQLNPDNNKIDTKYGSLDQRTRLPGKFCTQQAKTNQIWKARSKTSICRSKDRQSSCNNWSN
ncbi:unnamed protein product [Euphydryas editha]|uniref:Uncharacterized protein n=1 Tax=Euphydryas editha TaxID=104508 RepID=A0AAU9UWD3_EUPED|nr:unnamed protein product [Euphydryas editha]